MTTLGLGTCARQLSFEIKHTHTAMYISSSPLTLRPNLVIITLHTCVKICDLGSEGKTMCIALNVSVGAI